MSEVPPILVTGALGCIGEAVCDVLRDRGVGVVGMDMRSPTHEEGKKFYSFIKADITDEASLASAVAGASGIVHLAGWVHRLPRDKEEENEVYHANDKATGDLCHYSRKSGARIVLASTVAVYGEKASGRLNEDSPVSPSNAYGRSKLLAESHVLDAGGTVLRFPMVYGAKDRGNMARMIRAIRKGWFVVPGKGSALRTFVGRWNAARAIRCALSAEKARGRTYLVTDDEDIRLGALCDLIAELCGCRRSLRVPSTLVAGAAVAGSALKKLLGRRMPFDWSSYRKLTEDLSFDGSRIRDDLGYRPIKTIREGLKEEVDWLLGSPR